MTNSPRVLSPFRLFALSALIVVLQTVRTMARAPFTFHATPLWAVAHLVFEALLVMSPAFFAGAQWGWQRHERGLPPRLVPREQPRSK